MDTSLAAEMRTQMSGKSSARKLRKAGRMPAVVYGQGSPATHIHVDPKQLVEIFRKSGNRNTIVQIGLDGKTIPCLVREVQRHPLRRNILHVDFYSLTEAQPVEVMVRLNPVGRALGEQLGGRVRMIRREILVRCPYDRIPATVDYDISWMNVDDMVKVSQLTVPEGVEFVYDSDFNVITIYGKQVEIEDEEEGEEEAEEVPVEA